MNISDLIKEYGAYYEQAGQNKKRILGLLSQGIELPKHCTAIKTDDTIYRLSQLIMGDLVQSFQQGWTPKSDIAFEPNELRLYHMKVDLEIDPDAIEDSWLGFLASENVSRKEWPLIKFLIEHPEQGIISKINDNMELKEYGKGVYEAPGAGTAGITGKSMNGVKHLLTEGVNNETINSIDIQALNKDTIFDQVEAFVDGISQIYQNVKMNIFMSPYWAKMYHRDKRGQGFYQIASDAQVGNNIDFSPQYVVGTPALNGEGIIFATPRVNLIHLTKKAANKTRIKLEESKRTVALLADWWEGLGFGMDAAVWTNIQKESGS